MLVTITNASSSKVHVSMLWASLDVGESKTVSRTAAQLDAETQLKQLVVDGKVTLSFAEEATDAGMLMPVGLGVQSDASRPDPATMAPGSAIFNTDDAAPNYSDGTDWKDAAGVTT